MARLLLLAALVLCPALGHALSAGAAVPLEAVSARFLGHPYLLDPLGEGPGTAPDPDPVFRTDAFDCATFVETTMALALAPSEAEVVPTLDAIRYDGPRSYANRNHFFDRQWITANTRKGFVRDISREVGGGATHSFGKTVTRAQWDHRSRSRAIVLPEARLPLGTQETHYLPLDRLGALARTIPSGTVFALIRADRPGVPFVTTHVGFIFQTSRGTIVRHARQAPVNRVVDEDFGQFVARFSKPRPWKVLGLQLFEVRRPQPAPGLMAAPGPGAEPGETVSDSPG